MCNTYAQLFISGRNGGTGAGNFHMELETADFLIAVSVICFDSAANDALL